MWFNFSNFSFLFEGIFTVLPKNKVCYVMFFCYLPFFMLFIYFYVLPVTCYLRFCLNGYTLGHEFLGNKMLLGHTVGCPYITRMSEDFLSEAYVNAAMLLIVKCWLNWVKKETWTKFSSEFLM